MTNEIKFTGKETRAERLLKLKLIRQQIESQKNLTPKFLNNMEIK